MINTLQKLIDEELEQTSCHDKLSQLIEKQSNTLRALLSVPSNKTVPLLLNFACRYIKATPLYIDAFNGLAQASGIEKYAGPFLEEALALCFNDHPVADATSGPRALLCKVYMAHRIMEELNDHIAIKRQLPLAPLEMGHTNLIVHTLIGDEPANLLDQTVLIQFELVSANLSSDTDGVFESAAMKTFLEQHQTKGWGKHLEKWPCLKEDLALLLD